MGTPLIVSSYGFSARGCGAPSPDERTNERTNQRTNEPTNERTNERTNEPTNERTNQRTIRTNERASERASERVSATGRAAGRVGLSGREDLSRSTRQSSSFIHPSIHPSIYPASKPASQANQPASKPASEPSIHRRSLLSYGERVYPRRRWRRTVEWYIYHRLSIGRVQGLEDPPGDFSRPPAGSGRPLSSSTTCVSFLCDSRLSFRIVSHRIASVSRRVRAVPHRAGSCRAFHRPSTNRFVSLRVSLLSSSCKRGPISRAEAWNPSLSGEVSPG